MSQISVVCSEGDVATAEVEYTMNVVVANNQEEEVWVTLTSVGTSEAVVVTESGLTGLRIRFAPLALILIQYHVTVSGVVDDIVPVTFTATAATDQYAPQSCTNYLTIV